MAADFLSGVCFMRVFSFPAVICFSLALLFSGVFAGFADAAESASKEPPLPAPIQNLVAEGAQIRYLGRESGLDGWVTIKNGQEQYFYVTVDQQAILMGIMFNNKGDVVTLRQINALRDKEGPSIDRLAGFPEATAQKTEETKVPEGAFDSPKALMESASKSKPEQMYESVETANWVSLGQPDAPAIYSFIDPECPHCHDLIQDVRKSGYLEKGLLQLRLIPVGLMSEDSLKEAAFLLAAPDAEALLYRHLDGDKTALPASDTVNTQGVQRNIVLMQDWKLDVTPFSVYRDRAGKVKIVRGRPSDLKKIVADLK